MKNTVNTLFRTALPRYGKRSVFFLTVIAIPVLLILLGQSALLSVEGEWAACSRIAVDDGTFLDSGSGWKPDDFHNVIGGCIVRELSNFVPLSEWLIRIPAVLAALALLAGSMVLALEVADRKTAVLTGWLMLGSYGFLYWGRVGSGEMFAAAALVWAAVLFYGNVRNRRVSFRIGLDFFFLFFAVLVMCGLTSAVGMVIFLLPQWRAMLVQNKLSLRRIGILFASGICALLSIAALMFAAVYMRRFHDGFWGNICELWRLLPVLGKAAVREFFSSAGINIAEGILHLPRLMLPWTLLLPAAVWNLWSKRGELQDEHKRLLYGIVWFILCVGIFPVRRWGTVLPVLGPALILLALSCSTRFNKNVWEERSEAAVRSVFMIAAALVLALPCTWPLWTRLLGVKPPLLLLAVAAVTGVFALAVLMYTARPGNLVDKIIKRQSPLAGTVFAGVLLSVFVNCVLFPEMNMFRTERDFWKRSRVVLAQCYPQPELVLFYKMRVREPAIFYLESGIPFKSIVSPGELDLFLRNTGGKLAVVSQNSPETVRELRMLAQKNRRRFHEGEALVTEAHPVAFVRSDKRSNGYALWILEF
ncbi:MAG: hypothetical protein IKC89_04690 [Lentisphaeria bacterium]|nr:hypothetical protein [Lentisphaeria bacterium]